MNQRKAFIFDMDGVIIDSEPLHSRVKMETFAHFGLPFDEDELDQYMGRTSAAIFSDVLAREHRTDITVQEITNYKHAHYLELALSGVLQAVPGSLDLIRRLREAGVPLALATSSWRRVVDAVLVQFGLTDTFQSVISGSELPKSKPDPAIYRLSAEALDVSPCDCVVLEDTAAGVAAAKGAGMYCIGFRSPHSGVQDLSRADEIVDDLAAVDIAKLFSV
ncbi:HAD family hydrolase [Selenomonas sp.]|uniref:HAD family hydrolase n=1 Tax=Selenomonas sp. TaxID=2053611 RepID=UPI0025E6A2C9|nr:HAD family phosphatase [Selenomonas sp.]MCI6085943.1 HAD family phosphatase [Selenomonas sp.]MDY3296827.1 HAD family phosphatase [Selenomonas sp.]MDY4415810.1 HAD family phosphatase [Selenomonas sp.]